MMQKSVTLQKVFTSSFKAGLSRSYAANAAQNANASSQKEDTAIASSKSLSSLLDEQCVKLQHKDALRVSHQNLRWTYTELQTWVDAAANGFLNNSYKKGSSVISFLGNDTESVAVNLAASKVGVNVVNVRPGSMTELASSLEKVKPQGLMMLLGDKEKESIIELIPELDRSSHDTFRSKRFPFLHQVINTHFHNIVEDAMFYREFHQPDQIPNQAQKASKAISNEVVISSFLDRSSQQKNMTQKEVSEQAYSVGQKIGLSFSDRVCNVLPLSSPLGQITVWSTFLHGSFLVLPSSTFDAQATLDAISKEHCTVLVASPDQIQALVSLGDKFKKQISTLKKVLVVRSDADQNQNVSGASDSLRQLGLEVFA